MKPTTFMLIAGEPSGDLLGAELVAALKLKRGAPAAKFFGAGGAKMAAAGVDLAFDMTQHSVIGLWEVLRRYGTFKRLFDQLLILALERKPDVLVCVDFSGFNRRFAAALRWEIRLQPRRFAGWRPRIVQFVSPQVWASRPARARKMARDFDLLLSIFPFEQDWYAEHAPAMRVEFVGHPMGDRHANEGPPRKVPNEQPVVLLLPGSRVGELKRHLPVMVSAARLLSAKRELTFHMVLPSEKLAAQARGQLSATDNIQVQTGGLAEMLARADLAIASTGTVTMECAFFGVPTVTLYKTSWGTYQVGKRIVKVKSLTMPNLLAGEAVFPEFIQDAATPENISGAAHELLNDAPRCERIRAQLAKIVGSLGGSGACQRAAAAIWNLVDKP
ncbi:MAG: lipid-A-disaccharide synthase [Verrucomicrobiota bacterium]|jgi:lipid-A-disaccharide synthase